MRQFFGHHFRVEESFGVGLVTAVVHIKHVVVIAQDLVKIANELAHEHFGPVDEEDRLLSVETIFVLILKAIFDICIK